MENNYMWLILAGFVILSLIVVLAWFIKKSKGTIVEERWENDKIKSRHFISSKGLKQGEECYYYRNGKVNKKLNWVNNQIEGCSTVYYGSGKKYIEASYKAGELDGNYSVYAQNGAIIWSAIYEKGVMISYNNHESAKNSTSVTVNKDQSLESVVAESSRAVYNHQKELYEKIRSDHETADAKTSKRGIIGGALKMGRMVTGVEAYKYRKHSIAIKEACEQYYDIAYKTTEEAREKLNSIITSFGTFRLESLQKTTGRFLGYLKDMNQNNNIREYEILAGIGIDNVAVKKMEKIDMAASQALKSTATVSALGAAAAMGTPTLVTGAVSALATASTGTAISSLSGVAATNATLAWLGGGSLAAGGGGMAAGAATLTAITTGATAGVGLIAAGLISSTYYSKKLTQAKSFQKDVECEVANMEKLWVLMDGINKRTCELTMVTEELRNRLVNQLELLEPLVVAYDSKILYYNTVFQKAGLLAKAMSDVSQTPLLDDQGIASDASANIIEKTYTILNNSLANHG